jgi:hypothetical protein
MATITKPDFWGTRGIVSVKGSDLLEELVWAADDAGRDPEIVLDHDRDGLVRSVVLDGIEYENSAIREEQEDYDYYVELRRYGN